ncbi:MAG: UrcA family protein [Lysobacterales bacterium]|jgi:UrcA family protein
MKRNTSYGKVLAATATAWVFVFAYAFALADEKNQQMEEIVVQAPVSVERTAIHSASDPTVKTEVVELTRKVYIGDLDLSKYADVQELESRIRLVAQDSCKRLSDMFPLSDMHGDDRRCVEKAIKSALSEKESAIAAAQ